jgi:hypothetical protein
VEVNRDKERDWVYHMALELKIKPDTRILHTKHKIIDSTEETDTIRYIERRW